MDWPTAAAYIRVGTAVVLEQNIIKSIVSSNKGEK